MSNKWNEEITARLFEVVGEDVSEEVSHDTVVALSEEFDFSLRSVASKLRNLGFTVEKVQTVKSKSFTEDQEDQLREFVESNPGKYTYSEIAAALFGDEISGRKVQGKLLSMELTDLVKPTEHVAEPKKFSDEEEETFINMASTGAFIEDIAETLDKSINSIRGKALSLLRAGKLASIPKLREVKVTETEDPLEALGDISGLTVAEIAEKLGKSERGVKTMLTRRGVKVKNYDGEKKREKLDNKED